MAVHDPNPPTGSLRGESTLQLHATVESHRGVDAAYSRFSRALGRMDLHAIEAIFTADAVYLTLEGAPLEGSAAISASFGAFFDHLRVHDMEVRVGFEIDERRVQGDFAWDQGSYTLLGRIGTAEVPIRRGRFLGVFRRSEDRLEYRLDAVSVLPLVRTIRSPGVRH